jgi:hypothetical protein
MALLLERGIAEVIEDAGLGDFSAPASAVPPAIVVGEELESPDQSITVNAFGGAANDRVLGRFPKFVIINRDPSYAAARDLADAIHAALDQHQGALDSLPCGRIQPDTLPAYLGRDPSGKGGGLAKFTQTVTVFTHDL